MSDNTHMVTRSSRAAKVAGLLGVIVLIVLIAAPWWAGRAVLGSGHGGLAEMIGDGEAGRVVEPTMDAWVDAFTKVAADRDGLLELGSRARERAAREHGFNDLLDRVLQHYTEAIDG